MLIYFELNKTFSPKKSKNNYQFESDDLKVFVDHIS